MSPPALTRKLETQYSPWPHFPAGRLFLSTSLTQLSLTAPFIFLPQAFIFRAVLPDPCTDLVQLSILRLVLAGHLHPALQSTQCTPGLNKHYLCECQFCKHWEAIIKSLLAIPGMCLKLRLYREVNVLLTRGLVKPLGRIRHCPLCPELKGLFLEGNGTLAGTS